MMIYGVVLALLVAVAAHFLDRGLRGLGKPTRWVWIGALVTGGLAPFFPRLIPAGAPEVGGGLRFPVEFLYEAGTIAASTLSGSRTAIPAVEVSLGFLWFVGAFVVLLILAAGWLQLHSQRRSWEACKVGGEDVLLSDGVGPAVMGLMRPLIVLPRWVLILPKEELGLVILHEREHREARDPAFLAVGLLLVAVSPWDPVLWWAFLRLRLAVDGDCDSRVLARGISPKNYAELLLDFAARGGRSPALAPAMADGRGTNLEKRLVMIRTSLGKHRAWASALAATAALALIVVACETPLPQESTDADLSLAAAEDEVPARLTTAVESGWITQAQAEGIGERLVVYSSLGTMPNVTLFHGKTNSLLTPTYARYADECLSRSQPTPTST